MLEPVEVKHQNHAEEYIVVLEYRRVLFGYFLDFLGCVFDRKCVTHQCDVLQELVLLLSMLDSLLVCHQLIPIFILIRPVCLLVFLLHVADVEELSHIVRHRYPAWKTNKMHKLIEILNISYQGWSSNVRSILVFPVLFFLALCWISCSEYTDTFLEVREFHFVQQVALDDLSASYLWPSWCLLLSSKCFLLPREQLVCSWWTLFGFWCFQSNHRWLYVLKSS